MSTNPDPSISPSISVEVVDALRDGFVIGTTADNQPAFDPGFVVARQTMESLRTTAELLNDAEKSVRGAKDATNERRLRAAAEAKLTGARKSVDSALNSLGERRAAIEGDIESALGVAQARTEVVAALRSGEIRSYLRGLSPDDRFAAMREAINAGDAETTAAFFSATPVASGVGRDRAALLRTMAEGKFAPAQVRTREGLDRLSRVLSQARDVLSDRFGGLTGEGDGRQAAAQRALKRLEGGAA